MDANMAKNNEQSKERAGGAAGIDVAYVARLARIHLDDAEKATFQRQLEDIVSYVRKVQELDVSGVEPTAHGIPVCNVFRRDEIRQGLQRAEVLSNAPSQRDDQFAVPKIIE